MYSLNRVVPVLPKVSNTDWRYVKQKVIVMNNQAIPTNPVVPSTPQPLSDQQLQQVAGGPMGAPVL